MGEAKTGWVAVKRVVFTDRLHAEPFGDRPRAARTVGWLILATMYLVGWGQGVIVAIKAMGAGAHPVHFTTANVSGQVAWLAIMIAVTIGGMIALSRFDVNAKQAGLAPASGSAWCRQLRAVPIYMVISATGFAVASLMSLIPGLQLHNYPAVTYDNGALFILDVAQSVMAGPSEEVRDC